MPHSEQDTDSGTPNNTDSNQSNENQMIDDEFNNLANQTEDVHGQNEQPIDTEFNNWANQTLPWITLILGACLLLIGRKQNTK